MSPAPGTAPRAVASVSVTMPDPVVVDGQPTIPRYLGTSESAGTAREGPKHLHAIPNPDPWHSPDLPQPPVPPKAAGGFACWRVHDLPDPASFGGWYWLGARTGVDGTAGLPDACTHWPASTGSYHGAPPWHSRYPFKPSVVSAQHWLYGGGTVDHPKAVNFNSQYIEHMWLEFGPARPQPFSWVIAAMLPTYPGGNYTQYLLDAGRNPFDIGLPSWFGANNCYTPRTIHEPLGYRTLLTATTSRVRASVTARRGVQAVHHPNAIPRMYFGVYDGDHSIVGDFSSRHRYLRRGKLPNPAGQNHRYTVLGRRQGVLSQAMASHLLVFEIRYYNDVLSPDQLAQIYAHLSSVYSFGQY